MKGLQCRVERLLHRDGDVGHDPTPSPLPPGTVSIVRAAGTVTSRCSATACRAVGWAPPRVVAPTGGGAVRDQLHGRAVRVRTPGGLAMRRARNAASPPSWSTGSAD
ncbi:hypothetical protein [Streptomyces sp. NBC_01367]|uniref:hypothetical protein n=1 Tax=Streptomyces sp. NBC_01367 TaxID=2903841 RepID=UPI0032444142